MSKRNRLVIFSIAVLLTSAGVEIGSAFSEDMDVKELAAKHIQSIGSPETVKGIKSRQINGTALVEFIQGGTGKMSGAAQFVSVPGKEAIIMNFGGNEYPGEYFAFDGKEVTVKNMTPGQKSPIADFIYRYPGMMKEGLLGGALSLDWPFLHADKNKKRLKYAGKETIEGTELYVVEYGFSDKQMKNVKVRTFFETETFRHVRTEYRVRISGEMGLQADAVVADTTSNGDTIIGVSRPGGIHDAVPDSYYLLVETFSDFKEVDGMTLPHNYAIQYSVQGQGSSFLANWFILPTAWQQGL